MSTPAKVLTGLVALAILGGAAYYYQTHSKPELTPEEKAEMTAQETGMSPVASTSDAALEKDQAAIDTQLKGLDEDQSTLGASVAGAVVAQ